MPGTLVTVWPFCADRNPVPWMSWMARGPVVPPPPPPPPPAALVGSPGVGSAALHVVDGEGSRGAAAASAAAARAGRGRARGRLGGREVGAVLVGVGRGEAL